MYCRRRPTREIAFSFDSFLDMVANVVGVIIRLILVVWVGARAYTGLVIPPPEDAPPAEVSTDTGEETGDVVALPVEPPLEDELLPHQRELARLQQQLLEQMRAAQQAHDESTLTDKELAALAARKAELDTEAAGLDKSTALKGQEVQTLALTADELQKRYQRLSEEIAELKKLPPQKKSLRYRTPVSEPLFSEELEFECCHGRVTFIETGALIEEVKREFSARKAQFFGSDSSTQHIDPIGAFGAVFKVQREQLPVPTISVTEGFFEPVQDPRGEALETAMMPRSAFRQIADLVDPQRTAVTFWVYPDSFALYRQLRDYLYERNITVAGRPLPAGAPIGWSRHGTAARGQ